MDFDKTISSFSCRIYDLERGSYSPASTIGNSAGLSNGSYGGCLVNASLCLLSLPPPHAYVWLDWSRSRNSNSSLCYPSGLIFVMENLVSHYHYYTWIYGCLFEVFSEQFGFSVRTCTGQSISSSSSSTSSLASSYSLYCSMSHIVL